MLYEVADNTVTDRMQELLNKHHPMLAEWEVDVRVLFAVPEKAGQELKLHGYEVAGLAQKVGTKERAEGLGDCRIIIFKPAWAKYTKRQRDALLDHELNHFEPTGKRDGLGRPKIALRLHDWELGGFAEISERYGANALEVIGVRHAHEEFGQLFLNWKGAPS